MAEVRLPSTETLRRSALTRSAQRNAQVARRRIFWRWVGWAAGHLLRWVVMPAVLIAAAVSALYHGTPPATQNPSTPPAAPAREPGLHLRMDDQEAAGSRWVPRPPQAQSGASPIVDDRSSRER